MTTQITKPSRKCQIPLQNRMHQENKQNHNHDKKISIIKEVEDTIISYDNAFILRKLHNQCFYEHVFAQFAPVRKDQKTCSHLYEDLMIIDSKKRQNKGQQPNKVFQKTIPVFNQDHRYFTPAFLRGCDLIFYQEDIGFDLANYKEKLKKAEKLASLKKCTDPIMKPKPKSLYCHVCKKQYNDYAEHIIEKNHLNKIKNNKINNCIHQMAGKYKKKRDQEIKQNIKSAKSVKTKQIAKICKTKAPKKVTKKTP